MRIERERWVIMRNNRTEIFCGLASNYTFKPIDNIGNTAIKTCELPQAVKAGGFC